MNPHEICKLSYSNVEDSHRAVSQLVKHPAVTSFCKLTQNPAMKKKVYVATVEVIPTVF